MRGRSRCCLRRAITSQFPTAKCSTPGCMSATRAAPSAGCRASSATGTRSMCGSTARPRPACRSVWCKRWSRNCWSSHIPTRCRWTARSSTCIRMAPAPGEQGALSDRPLSGWPAVSPISSWTAPTRTTRLDTSRSNSATDPSSRPSPTGVNRTTATVRRTNTATRSNASSVASSGSIGSTLAATNSRSSSSPPSTSS